MDKVSIIIPARNEEYLEPTIKDLLRNAGGDIDILVGLDGYLPEPQIITNDARVRFFHFKEPIGQRAMINYLVRQSDAKYIMKLDAHCAVDEGFDVKLKQDCKYDWTVVPTMYNLDINTFTPKWHKITNYMYISSPDSDKPFRPQYFEGKKKDEGRRQPKNDKMIDDVMCCMGCCWFMHKDRFLDQGGCDENHVGGWGQQSVEVSLKAWLSGGSLKVNKNTWFAHWFRGDVGFPYEMPGSQVEKVREYSRDLWLNDKWPPATRKLQWVIDKFDPPGWREKNMAEFTPEALQSHFYKKVHLKKGDPKWRGIKVIKLPTDLLLYSQVIWDNKPDFIVEIGTAFCGMTLFFADMLDINGKGKVISIDPNPRGPLQEHDRIIYLRGDSKSPEIIEQIRNLVGDGSVMLSIDGNHKRAQVKWELKLYADIVTSGQYMVAEDCYDRESLITGPGEARDWFLGWNKQYTLTNIDKQFLIGFTKGGWLLKK